MSRSISGREAYTEVTMLVSIGVDMEILTWTHKKTITQTQFVSVVSKVISDGIFNERFLKIKNVGKIKKR